MRGIRNFCHLQIQSFPFETRSEGVNWSLRTWCEKAGATKGGWRVAFGDGQGAKCSWPVRYYQVTPPHNNECCAWGKNRCFRNCVIIADAAVTSQKKDKLRKTTALFSAKIVFFVLSRCLTDMISLKLDKAFSFKLDKAFRFVGTTSDHSVKSVAGPRPSRAVSQLITQLVTFPIKFHLHSRKREGLNCGDNGWQTHQTADRFTISNVGRSQTVGVGTQIWNIRRWNREMMTEGRVVALLDAESL